MLCFGCRVALHWEFEALYCRIPTTCRKVLRKRRSPQRQRAGFQRQLPRGEHEHPHSQGWQREAPLYATKGKHRYKKRKKKTYHGQLETLLATTSKSAWRFKGQPFPGRQLHAQGPRVLPTPGWDEAGTRMKARPAGLPKASFLTLGRTSALPRGESRSRGPAANPAGCAWP